MGKIRSQATGSVSFRDLDHDINCEVQMGRCKGKPTDYFESPIL